MNRSNRRRRKRNIDLSRVKPPWSNQCDERDRQMSVVISDERFYLKRKKDHLKILIAWVCWRWLVGQRDFRRRRPTMTRKEKENIIHSFENEGEMTRWLRKKKNWIVSDNFVFVTRFVIEFVIQMNERLQETIRSIGVEETKTRRFTRSTSGMRSIFFCNSSPMSCASLNDICSGKTMST